LEKQRQEMGMPSKQHPTRTCPTCGTASEIQHLLEAPLMRSSRSSTAFLTACVSYVPKEVLTHPHVCAAAYACGCRQRLCTCGRGCRSCPPVRSAMLTRGGARGGRRRMQGIRLTRSTVPR
jgi:hypothetical protein